jgi:CubicO group peptidase (beta-lactamase class C family)
VAKSVTSTLVGAAVKDGDIKSLDDKVTRYIPGLRGSAYDQVNRAARQAVDMTEANIASVTKSAATTPSKARKAA